MLSLTKVTPHTQSDNNVEKARWRQSLPGKNKKCIKTTCWKTDRKSLNSDISWSVFGNLSLEGLSEYFSTRRMATYNEVVLTKFASNYTTWWHNHSKCWSRLLCPQKIQLESRRTSAVLIRRMATYNEVVLTKVASNYTTWWHNHSKWLSRLPCPPKIQLESRRTGAVLIRRMAT